MINLGKTGYVSFGYIGTDGPSGSSRVTTIPDKAWSGSDSLEEPDKEQPLSLNSPKKEMFIVTDNSNYKTVAFDPKDVTFMRLEHVDNSAGIRDSWELSVKNGHSGPMACNSPDDFYKLVNKVAEARGMTVNRVM